MKVIAVAFVWALLMSQLLGLCLAGLLFWLEWPWWYWPLLLGTYTLWNGWNDARDLLAKRLGNKGDYRGVKHRSRVIPISLDAGTVFETVLPNLVRKRSREIEVDSGYVLYSAKAEVSEALANRFIRTAQIRDDRGKPPFSREYWLKTRRPTISRDEYDCIVENLVDFGFVSGRRQGKSGNLNTHPEKVIKKLRSNLN